MSKIRVRAAGRQQTLKGKSITVKKVIGFGVTDLEVSIDDKPEFLASSVRKLRNGSIEVKTYTQTTA